MEPTATPDELRRGIRLSADEWRMLRELAAWWFPGEQRKQSQAVRRLIREAWEREKAAREGRGK